MGGGGPHTSTNPTSIPLPAPQPRHWQQHRVPEFSSVRERNKFPFPPQLNFPLKPLASSGDTARSSNIFTCTRAQCGPASPLINSITIITVIAGSSQQCWDQYPLLYDGFLHLRWSARKMAREGTSSIPHSQTLQGTAALLSDWLFHSFYLGVITGLGERDHLPCFPLSKRAVST